MYNAYMQKLVVMSAVAGIILMLSLVGYGFFRVSKSRTFQFFGGLVHRVNTSEKVIALTFDDGPNPYATEILNILKQKNVKATFFLIGSELEKYPELGRNIVAAGHEVGNHSYSHQRMVLKSQVFIAREIEATNRLLRNAGNTGVIHFRPPYSKKLFGLPWYLKQHNMKTIMVDVEPDTYGTDADFLVTYTLEHAKPGSIILLHPFCDTCSGQREAIGKIIDGMHAKGYKFETVSSLLTFEKN